MSKNPLAHDSGPAWSARQRLVFIEFRVYWEGRINRSDLMAVFGVSAPQAAIDLRAYRQAAPDNLRYNPKSKTYVPGQDFAPLYWRPDAAEFLRHLRLSRGAPDEARQSWVRAGPEFAIAQIPVRHVDTGILRGLLGAIRDHAVVRIDYQSNRSIGPRTRKIVPRRLASDGHRWHVRAYDLERADYADFVLARILRAEASPGTFAETPDDTDWHQLVEVVLAPNPDMEPSLQRAYRFDYGVTDDVLRVSVRRALLFYFLTNLRLDFDRTRSKPAFVNPLVVVNRDEVEAALLASGYKPIQGQNE